MILIPGWGFAPRDFDLIPNKWSAEPDKMSENGDASPVEDGNDATTEARGRNRKIRIRAGHKAHVTKMATRMEKSLKDYDSSMEVDYLAYRDNLKRKLVIISKLDEEILETLDDDEAIILEIETSETIQLDIQTKIIEIDRLLEKASLAKKETKSDDKSIDITKKLQAMVKLPKIEIQKFSGDPKDYRTFRDAFNVAIGDRHELSDVEKFTYLRSYVRGDAENSIKGLPAKGDNYAEAISILEQRYGNVQVIVNSHMDALIKLPQVVNEKQTKKIRQLYDQIETNLRSLKSLGVKPESYGCLLVPILLSKLPPSLNLHLSRKFDSSTDVWEVNGIMNELRKELEARERCEIEKEKIDKPKHDPTTLEALHSEQSNLICAFCDGHHYADQCKVVTDLSKRKELLKRKRRCFLCTRPNHQIKTCMSKRNCYLCKGRHHTSLCDRKSGDLPKEKIEEKKTTGLSAVSPKSTILLQSAQLLVGNGDESCESINCKVLLDSGSQRTHITKRVARLINSRVHHKEMLQINGYGGIRTKPKIYDVIEFDLKKKGFSTGLKLQGLVVEKICTPLQGRYVKGRIETFPHLVNL